MMKNLFMKMKTCYPLALSLLVLLLVVLACWTSTTMIVTSPSDSSCSLWKWCWGCSDKSTGHRSDTFVGDVLDADADNVLDVDANPDDTNTVGALNSEETIITEKIIPLVHSLSSSSSSSLLAPSLRRKLSSSRNWETIRDFSPLNCNPTTWSSNRSCNTLVSDNLPTSSDNALTIPCNQCYTFDIGGMITLSGGINVVGKLVFPANHRVDIYTPYVIVQGELEITGNSDKISPENMATRFILTGTKDVLFTPSHAPNENVCDLQPNGQCNFGRKAFVVAGGKVNINSMPESSCRTFTPVKKKIYNDPFNNSANLCDELIFNGDAEGNGFDPSPMGSVSRHDKLIIVEEDGNKFWRIFGRRSERSSIFYKFPDTTCFARGVEYVLSTRIRLHYSDGFVGGAETYYWYISYNKVKDSEYPRSEQTMLFCPAQTIDDGWVTCSGIFMVDEILSERKYLFLAMGIENERDGARYNVDFDDISVRYHRGYLNELVVDSKDVSCWGNGSKVHVTSAMYYSTRDEKSNGFQSQIEKIVDNGDGTAVVRLSEASTLPIISQEENSEYAIELVLVSRNIVIEGLGGENDKGGYMQVLRTPNIAQTVVGVEFVNMGRKSEDDKFALQLLYCGNVKGTLISRNSFYQSNQRCIVLEGTSNVIISHNIGYQTYGHCIYIGLESKSNLVTRNLVSDTKTIKKEHVLASETDDFAAGFLNWYEPNDFTYNVAVAGQSDGFTSFCQDATSYEIGTFDHNTAKSNFGNGFQFSNYLLDKELVLSNVKAIKNRLVGFSTHSSYKVGLGNCIFAENTYFGIDVRFVNYFKIQDTVIKGYTLETKNMVKPPYFNKPCESYFFSTPIGIKMPTGNWDDTDKKRGNLNNVRFTDFDHSDNCTKSIPISFYAEANSNNHFNFLTTFNNVTTDGRRMIDAMPSDEQLLKDIIIHDVNGSSDPSGRSSQAGVFVSNTRSMKAFAGGVCKKYPDGTSYCSESCFRTIAFTVDQSGSDELAVRVTRQSDGKETILPYTYKYDDDLHLKSFSEHHRLFSVSLPSGSYKIDFLKDFWKQVWPGFVLSRWQDPPECEGYASVEDVTFVEPRVPCQDLTVNGDVEAGISHWLQNNPNNPAYGEILEVEGVGVDDSTALRYINRSYNNLGVGQNLDVSCLHQSKIGDYYEIQVYFQLEEGNKPFLCDPYSNSLPDRCPEVIFYEYWFEGEELHSTINRDTRRATTVIPNTMGTFNVVHGIFRVDESIKNLDRLYMSLTYVHEKFDLIVDNLTVRKLPLACRGELVRNHDFEDGGKYWTRAGSAHLDIEEVLPSGKLLKISEKDNRWHGVSQILYLDKVCLSEKQRFEINVSYRIESAANGTKYECNPEELYTELECVNMIIQIQSPLGPEQFSPNHVIAAKDLKNGWSTLSGIITVSKKLVAHDSMSLYLHGTHKTMNVFYNNISISPIPRTCQNQILNSDFEIGDTRLWEYNNNFVDVDIFDSGADGSQYSVMVLGIGGAHGHALSQDLDMRCLEEGQEFQVNAKFRFLDVADMTSGVECDPNELRVTSETHCPTITIRGSGCTEGDFEIFLWNDIANFEWDVDNFNHFEKVFSVTSKVASCDIVRIEVGRFIHKGIILLVDDLELIQLTTSSPTPYPTFSPTKRTNSGPTIEPTIRTDAPTTNMLFVCPPVDSAPSIISSGSVMLQVPKTSLCTLTKSITSIESSETTLVPIARSYDNNPWEKSASDFATSVFGRKEILCYPAGCQLQLPALEEGAEYLLSSFSHSLSKTDEYARFLETATFGTTQKQLDSFEASGTVQNTIANWLADQMDSNVTEMTSHREFWRRGLNGRVPMSNVMGVPSHPCDANSRWRTISFVQHDNNMKVLDQKLRILGSGPFILKFNGQVRTVVSEIKIYKNGYENYKFNSAFDYKLCAYPELRIGGSLHILLEDGKCVDIKNPPVNLDGYESFVNNIFDFTDDALEPIDEWWDNGGETVFKSRKSLFDDPSFSAICATLPLVPEITNEPIFGRISNGKWFLFDPRLNLDTNTPSLPIPDGGKSTFLSSDGKKYCSNAPRTFLNENQCKLSSNACIQSSKSQVNIPLGNSTIAALNDLTGRYVYGIKGLLVKYGGIVLDHPCTPGLRSRWEPREVCNPTPLYHSTSSTLLELLSKSTDTNPHIRDIYFPEEGSYCNVRDTEPEIEIEVDGQCWKRVHDEHMSIFDMTYWVEIHPGGSFNIQKWSENNGTFLVYPSLLERNPHGMANWNNNWQKFTYVGRFGDSMELGDLPNTLKQIKVINFFHDSSTNNDGKLMVCGSFGEVGNDKSEGLIFDAHTGFYTVLQTREYNKAYNRLYVWLMIALQASDQLRQRVAWVFSQILVIVRSAILNENGRTEGFLYYYDIFVRNAFGNYRDILREVSYSTYMAETLSFLGSKSSAYMLERYRVKASADENFAREIMQLFTIGVYQLNMDGSFKLDENGDRMTTYSIKDIMSLSRAWTGFDRQLQRGNVEGYDSSTDPMKIIAEWRDRFPKSDTTDGYIGDRYPLCSDFPSKPFLRKGAKYRLLGSSNLPELMSDPMEFASEETATRLVLSETSLLRSFLCNEDQSSGNCVFQNTVMLPSNYGCTGIECKVDTVRVVQVSDNIYYEFVHPPCVTLTFYNDAVRIGPRRNADSVMCADPRLPVASEACCGTSGVDSAYASRNLKYSGERMSLATAESRCSAVSKEVCVYYRVDGNFFENTGYFWTPESCSLQVKVKRDGTVAIIHRPKKLVNQVMHVDIENNNYFKVVWERGGDYPLVENGCDGVCEVLESEGACICNTRTVEKPVFNNMPSNKEQLIAELSIGGVDPEIFDSDYYSSIVNSNAGITAYLKSGGFNAETIFKYRDDKGRTFFVKNIKSLVYLKGIGSGYTGHSFRNTPQFMSFIPSETNLRDAQYETEAVLDHLFFHDNTPPFLATRLIQRLVTSNPGPRYIRTVAEAFKAGSYNAGGISFGSGNYGDLAATFAAIYLDSGARSVVLDTDFASGALREPIVKVVGLMRSMEFVSRAPITMVHGMYNKIGQDAHTFESVFSFFRPDFKPHGRIGDAGLVSPEALLLDMPKISGLMNGLTSFVRFGLSSCGAGFGIQYCRETIYAPSELGILEFNRTSSTNQGVAITESFEGPSLVGGLDNLWVGRSFGSHNGIIVIDPLGNDDHVFTFSSSSTNERIFSPPIKNKDSEGNTYVVKFRYLGIGSSPGGCIGYVDAENTNSQTWALCDTEAMESKGQWVSCQFSIPKQLVRIVIGDIKTGGDAYFDDIQVVSGNENAGTTCIGVEVPKVSPQGQAGYSNTVVDRLSTLLTAGRLGKKTKSILVEAFDKAGSADDGLRVAQQLILTTAEFHSTNIVKNNNRTRDDVAYPHLTGKPYRAVIYLYLEGGCDSYNLLVPYTCDNDLYENYLDVRQNVALAKNQLLPISASDQVCSEFGIHEDLPTIKTLYDNEDLLFFANTGVLSKPVNKDNYYTETNVQLFSHSHMHKEAMTLDPYELSIGTGVLGRINDILHQKGHNVGSFSVEGLTVALVGKPGISSSPIVIGSKGVQKVYLDEIESQLPSLHNQSYPDSGLFGEKWSSLLMESIGTNDLLGRELDGLKTFVEFPDSFLGNSLETISKVISTRNARGVDVDTFYISKTGFDTHHDVERGLKGLFNELDEAIFAFSEEMKMMHIWNNVTVIQTSDFGRTLNPNGNDGTDHAWGGNYMMMGGSVKGGKVLGQYPDDLTDDGPLTLERGRMIPTTPWEAAFRGIALWLDIEDARIEEVCPNIQKFNSSLIIEFDAMFGEILVPAMPSSVPSMSPKPSTSNPPSSSAPAAAPILPTQAPVAHTYPPVASTPAPVGGGSGPNPIQLPTVLCTDDPLGWHDIDGASFDCEWYAQKGRCILFGQKPEFMNRGKTASQACCSCGGGNGGGDGGGGGGSNNGGMENMKVGFIMIDGKCMSMNKRNNKAVVWDCYGGNNQKWLYDNDTKQLKNMRSNYSFCLHQDQNNVVILKQCTARTIRQMWFPDETVNGDMFMFRSGSEDGQCLKLDASNAGGGSLIVEDECFDALDTKLFKFQALSNAPAAAPLTLPSVSPNRAKPTQAPVAHTYPPVASTPAPVGGGSGPNPIQLPTVLCTDDPLGWHDIDGASFDCEWYAQKGRCILFGQKPEFMNRGKTASQACCSCGGGNGGDDGGGDGGGGGGSNNGGMENMKVGFIMIDGKCMSMNKRNNKAVVWDCYGGNNQKWLYDNDTKQLKNMRSNYSFCLHQDQNNVVVLKQCTARTIRQMWFPDETVNGDMFIFRSGSEDGQCLKLDASNAGGGSLIVEDECFDALDTKLFKFQALL